MYFEEFHLLYYFGAQQWGKVFLTTMNSTEYFLHVLELHMVMQQVPAGLNLILFRLDVFLVDEFTWQHTHC